jgi:hypothetical protein
MPREKGGECESGEMVRGFGDTNCSFADTTPVRMPRAALALAAREGEWFDKTRATADSKAEIAVAAVHAWTIVMFRKRVNQARGAVLNDAGQLLAMWMTLRLTPTHFVQLHTDGTMCEQRSGRLMEKMGIRH